MTFRPEGNRARGAAPPLPWRRRGLLGPQHGGAAGERGPASPPLCRSGPVLLTASPLFSLRRPPLPASRRGQSSARRSAEGPGWAALPVLPAVGPPRFPSRRPSAAPASASSAASPGPSWMCCAAGPAGNRRGSKRGVVLSCRASAGIHPWGRGGGTARAAGGPRGTLSPCAGCLSQRCVTPLCPWSV